MNRARVWTNSFTMAEHVQQEAIARTAERPRQSGAPSNWRILSCFAKWPLPMGSCQMGKTLFQMSRVRSTTDAENSAAAALPKCYRFNQVCGIDTMEVRNPLDRENPIRISHVICHGTRYHQGARRQDMTATETFSTLRQFWLKHYDAMDVLIKERRTQWPVHPGRNLRRCGEQL